MRLTSLDLSRFLPLPIAAPQSQLVEPRPGEATSARKMPLGEFGVYSLVGATVAARPWLAELFFILTVAD